MKMMHTETTVHPDEFDHFQLAVDSAITFCLKELRVTGLFLEACFILTCENKHDRYQIPIIRACDIFLVQLDHFSSR